MRELHRLFPVRSSEAPPVDTSRCPPRRFAAALLFAVAAMQAATGAYGGDWGALRFSGREIAPGTTLRTGFEINPSFLGSMLDTLVVITRGATPGPALCLTAGIHGDEINGVEIAHRIYAGTDPAGLAGTLITVPAVNAAGFRSGSRYMPDRRDLNRFFPGKANGSSTAQVAFVVFEQMVRACDALIDLHTGSFFRTNLPQIRTDLDNPAALELARSFGVGIVLHGRGPAGSLRRAALDAGIPAVIYEAGEPLRFQEEEIARGVSGIRNVMVHLGMLPARRPPPPDSRIIRRTEWVRAQRESGVFLSTRRPGEQVAAGEVLGTVTDPITEATEVIRAPRAGLLIGMAVPQVVLTGYGLFHLGLEPQ